MGVGKSTFEFTSSSIVQDGGTTTINITRDNQSYSHRLRHGYGQFAALPVGDTSHVWSPTAADLSQFWAEVPSQKSRLVNVTLDTYNGATYVGSDTHALTVTLSDATGKPTLSNFAVTDSNSTTNGWGIIVPGKSTLAATKTATPKYGASIASTVYCYGDNEFTSIEDLVASIPATTTPTSFTIGCKTTDTRGFSTTSTLSKTVATYKAPTIDTFEVVRCDEDGAEMDSGTNAKVVAKGSWSSMKVGSTYKNPATFKVGYKAHTASSYTYVTFSVTGGEVDLSQVLSQTFSDDTDYDFSVSLVDSIGSAYSHEGVSFANSQSILYVSADGSEIRFGADSIYLGCDSDDAKINMCGGIGEIVQDEGILYVRGYNGVSDCYEEYINDSRTEYSRVDAFKFKSAPAAKICAGSTNGSESNIVVVEDEVSITTSKISGLAAGITTVVGDIASSSIGGGSSNTKSVALTGYPGYKVIGTPRHYFTDQVAWVDRGCSVNYDNGYPEVTFRIRNLGSSASSSKVHYAIDLVN